MIASIITVPQRSESYTALAAQVAQLPLECLTEMRSGEAEDRTRDVREATVAVLRRAAGHDWLLFLEDDVSLDVEPVRAFLAAAPEIARVLHVHAFYIGSRRQPLVNVWTHKGYRVATVHGRSVTDALLIRADAIPAVLARADGAGGSDQLFHEGLMLTRKRIGQVLTPRLATYLDLPSVRLPAAGLPV